MRIRPDRRESQQGLALYATAAGTALGLGAVEHQLGLVGWLATLVVYGPCLVACAIALVLPVRWRPWPLFAAFIVPLLFALLVTLIMLFAGGGGLVFLPLHMAVTGALIAGTMVVFDAAW